MEVGRLKRKRGVGKVAIVGVGLIGGSLGLALRERGIAREVAGVFRRRSSLEKAVKKGAVDWGTLSLKKGVNGAEVVVLAVPTRLIVHKGLEAAEVMEKKAVLTDAGSVKAAVVRELDRKLPEGTTFVGGHPVAGSEKKGVEAASGELFVGSLCALTPGRTSTPEGIEMVKRMWRSVGCRVAELPPERHDALLGEVSHLPHLAAAAVARAVSEEALGYGAGGFGDTTRIAGGDPDLWADIMLSNRGEIGKTAGRLVEELSKLRRAIADGSREEIVELLREARRKRELFEAKRKAISKGMD